VSIYVLTCGLTIIGNLPALASREDLDREPAAEVCAALASWAAEQAIHDRLDAVGTWVDHPRRRQILEPRNAGGLALATWRREGLSAELDGLYAAPPSPRARAEDRVVLLASDSARGVVAALLNAAVIGRPTRLWGGDPMSTGAPVEVPGLDGPGDPVEIVRIRGLVPGMAEPFLSAMAQVARALAWAATLPQAADGGLILHVAGGYKATIPFLMALAEFLPQVGRDATLPVSVYCKHETGRYATRIPLRRPPIHRARHEIEEVLDGRRPGGDRHFEHFLYADDGPEEEPRLTELGRVVHELLARAGGVPRPLVG